MVRPAFGIIEDGFRLFGLKSPLGRSTVDKLMEDLAVKGDKIQKELGFKPKYDIYNGWKASLDSQNGKS